MMGGSFGSVSLLRLWLLWEAHTCFPEGRAEGRSQAGPGDTLKPERLRWMFSPGLLCILGLGGRGAQNLGSAVDRQGWS